MLEVDAYIAVGSNIDPHVHVVQACDLLAEESVLRGTSTFYCTPALGRPDQPDYRNGVFWIRTAVPPRQLKYEVLRSIETRLGRVRGVDPFEARTIDLDLIVYGDYASETHDLRLPDPEIRERPFIAVALWELAPMLKLPDTGELLDNLVSESMRRSLTPDTELTRILRTRMGNE